ncbi:holin [Flindersiella endophytica]
MWTVAFWKAAGERAIKTFAQVLVALVGTNLTGLVEVNWVGALTSAALAAGISILTSLAGGPTGPSWGQEKLKTTEAAAGK